jgi:hypothetical protein
MTLLLRRSIFVILVAFVAGCSSSEPQGGPRIATFPVHGVVEVDGLPTELVEVICHPSPDSTGIKYPVSSMTDMLGAFTITTYEASDGLPEGTYTLTFQWLEPSLVPRDKFDGAFADPGSSQHKITVVKGQETDIGIIKLSTK